MADHPPPWRWTITGEHAQETWDPSAEHRGDDDPMGPGAMEDSLGQEVIGIAHDPEDGIGPFIAITSPGVDELLRAAPEMEALLRDLSASQSIVMDGETDEQRQHRIDGLRRAIMGAGPILQRLDAARKAGG